MSGAWARLLAAVLFLLSLSCVKDPTGPTRHLSSATFGPDVDDAQVWSHSGRLIAYHRRYPSADGPAGLYVISRWGGKPQFLAPGNFWWPRHLHFSPDDRYIVGTQDFALIIVDIDAGTVTEPMFTSFGTYEPDWSPDGKTIVYRRWISNAPPDSAGLHFFDPWAGTDRPFRFAGRGLFSTPLWSPDGREIAFVKNDDSVCIARLDGSAFRVLRGSPGRAYDELRWYTPRLVGREALVFFQLNAPGDGLYIVNRDGSGFGRAPFSLRYWDALSPDGTEMVTNAFDPRDSIGVLFVARVGDPSGGGRRQLTHWAPPPGTSGLIVNGLGPDEPTRSFRSR